jgi:hypothetical protein
MDTSGAKRSPWVWVGLGCLGLALLVGIAAATGGWFAYSKLKELGEAVSDPDARAAKAREILGVEAFPEGYAPAVALSMGSMMAMAILTDQALSSDGLPTGRAERGFVFVRAMDDGSRARALDTWLRGEGDGRPPIDGSAFDLGEAELLGRGALELRGGTARLARLRGTIGQAEAAERLPTVAALLGVDCGDQRYRMALWFVKDPSPGAPLTPEAIAGTPAEEAAIAAFLAPFDLCRRPE